MASSDNGSSSLQSLVEHHGKSLLAMLRVRAGAAAEDLLQDVWVVTARRWPDLEGRPEADQLRFVRAAALLTLRHHWRSHTRGRTAFDRLATADRTGERTAEPVDSWIDRAADATETLVAAWVCLQPAEQDLLRTRVVDETTYAVMAEQSGLTEAVLRKRVSRALAQLRDYLTILAAAGHEPVEISDKELEYLAAPDPAVAFGEHAGP